MRDSLRTAAPIRLFGRTRRSSLRGRRIVILPGQYYDAETGLDYNHMRDYDSVTGRYVESDPIGLQGGMNTYAYALSNPIRYADPAGLQVRFICRKVLGVPGGAQHCFVFVSCPAERWSRVLSLYMAGSGPHEGMGYKYAHTPGDIAEAAKEVDFGRDDPFNPNNTFNEQINPRQCFQDSCGYEKRVLRRFARFPAGYVPYHAIFGPNSNTFAHYLIGAGLLPSNAPKDTIFGGAPAIDAAPQGFFK